MSQKRKVLTFQEISEIKKSMPGFTLRSVYEKIEEEFRVRMDENDPEIYNGLSEFQRLIENLVDEGSNEWGSS